MNRSISPLRTLAGAARVFLMLVLAGAFAAVFPWWLSAVGLVALVAALPWHQRWLKAQRPR